MLVGDPERERNEADAVLDADLDGRAEPDGAPEREPVGDPDPLRLMKVELAVAEADMDVGVRVAEYV